MGIRFPSMILSARKILKKQHVYCTYQPDVPKGHIPVYVGLIERKRFVVPVSYLNHPLFGDFLKRAEEEFGFDHPMGGLTIPCKEDAFIEVTSRLHKA
ncbi:Auxin-responsive protein [Melia azedarach]|uniref:Auxin-responsive protein n=1 Tax=Melia azedarach TaxID=155640 RepID=A0ACC1Y0K0_MELAZ|nr:Auxin-responsive protein [Melia azedarach]